MPGKVQLHHPWLVAIWPGMGHVALNTAVYLMAKLEMTVIAEFETTGLFDVDHVEVRDGIIKAGRRPRNRLFMWTDPNKKHDLVIFVGEAQPPIGKYAFCRQLLSHTRELSVERVFTFAATATHMHPEHDSRVFGAATDPEGLEELKRLDVEILEQGHIGGLNGVLLAAAAEEGLHGICLLGEMPHIFSQFSFPKASLAILEVFTTIADMELDLSELAEQVRATDEQLGELLAQIEKTLGRQPPAEEEEYAPEPTERERLSAADERRIEELFAQAAKDRSKAFELKQELDRLGALKQYEDRFLDLFKKPE
jgi:proteasome assembly chaperone (PAC2) family protein